MPRQNISVSEETRSHLQELTATYGDMSAVIEEAVSRLHRVHFPERYEEPHIIGWSPKVFATDVVCSDTGRVIPAGTTAYREDWSDGRQGAILSRESLVADGVFSKD